MLGQLAAVCLMAEADQAAVGLAVRMVGLGFPVVAVAVVVVVVAAASEPAEAVDEKDLLDAVAEVVCLVVAAA